MAFCFQWNVYTAMMKLFTMNKSRKTVIDDIYLVFHHCDRNMCFFCVWFIFRKLDDIARFFDGNRRIYEFLTLPKKETRNLSLFAEFISYKDAICCSDTFQRLRCVVTKFLCGLSWLMLKDFFECLEFKFYCLWLYRIFKWCRFADQSQERPETQLTKIYALNMTKAIILCLLW